MTASYRCKRGCPPETAACASSPTHWHACASSTLPPPTLCSYFHRETLTTSIQGRACEVLTITSVEGASATTEPSLSPLMYPHSSNRANVRVMLFLLCENVTPCACLPRQALRVPQRARAPWRDGSQLHVSQPRRCRSCGVVLAVVWLPSWQCVHCHRRPYRRCLPVTRGARWDGFMTFLLSDDQRARLLRQHFVFKVHLKPAFSLPTSRCNFSQGGSLPKPRRRSPRPLPSGHPGQ